MGTCILEWGQGNGNMHSRMGTRQWEHAFWNGDKAREHTFWNGDKAWEHAFRIGTQIVAVPGRN